MGARKLIDILKTMPGDQTVSLESQPVQADLEGWQEPLHAAKPAGRGLPAGAGICRLRPRVSPCRKKTLKDLLGQVSFAMAVQDIRYYLNGILFVAEGKTLSLVATDGHRLAFASATLGGGAQAGSHPAAQDRDRAAAPAE